MIGKSLSEINGFEDVNMYVKFLNKEYLNDLLNGSIYMNNFEYFIKLEKEQKNKGQGDKLELAHVVRSNKVTIRDPKTKMVIATAPFGELIERYTGSEKLPVFCLTHLYASDFVITKVEGNVITAKIELPLEDQKLFEETFGDTAVVLSNEFTSRFIEAAKNSNLGLAIGDVLYQDYDFYSSTRRKEFDEQSLNILFWKDKFFKQQREARFILVNKSVENNFVLNIGDISGKSKVTSTKELLTDTEFEFAIN